MAILTQNTSILLYINEMSGYRSANLRSPKYSGRNTGKTNAKHKNMKQNGLYLDERHIFRVCI
ncbi:hypothetical protein PvtlMGM2_1083 [Prevotella sp. MGM2]|nr:hypothetical protein PvtlMGM2_1083 [Prevotella sp. MGM2]